MIPNLLSAFRICLVPVFIIVYFTETGAVKVYAISIYALAALTDFLDGFIARKLNLTTKLGKFLDPLGDKLMTVSVMTCLTVDGVIPVWAVTTAFTKELLMGIGGMVLHKKTQGDIPPSNILGKASTVAFCAVCLALMIFTGIPKSAAALMIAGAIALMLIALLSYILTFTSVLRSRARSGEADN
jgi:CDP-diacylglycerol--glycerol-3-phosphate 3-phosphatidyltransferase